MATNSSPVDAGILPRGFSESTNFRWPLVPSRSIVELVYGDGLTEKTRRSGLVPVYGTNGRCGWHDTPLAKGPGLILGRKGMGHLGVEWCNSDFWVIDTAYYVRPRVTDIDLKFLYYLVKYIGLDHLKDGTSNPSLTRDTFGCLLLPKPPLTIQREIARILTDFDNQVELNQRTNDTLESLARTLFKSWFLDFDPVRTKATGRKPVSLDPATAALFPSRLVSDDHGELPEGWSRQRIADGATINSWTLSKNDLLPAIDYIEISEVMRGDVFNVSNYIRGEEPSRARRRLRHGDTVLSTVRPDRGAYFLCLNPSHSLVASTGFAVVTPTTVPWSVIHCALTQPEVFEHLGHQAHGGAYPAVAPDVIGAYPLATPKDSLLLDVFHRVAGPLLERADYNRRTSRALAAMGDALLPKLMSGEIEVSASSALRASK